MLDNSPETAGDLSTVSKVLAGVFKIILLYAHLSIYGVIMIHAVAVCNPIIATYLGGEQATFTQVKAYQFRTGQAYNDINRPPRC